MYDEIIHQRRRGIKLMHMPKQEKYRHIPKEMKTMSKKIDYSIKLWEKEKKYIFEKYNLLEVQKKKK